MRLRAPRQEVNDACALGGVGDVDGVVDGEAMALQERAQAVDGVAPGVEHGKCAPFFVDHQIMTEVK